MRDEGVTAGERRQEAAQDISSPSAADATFGPWQLRARC